MLERSREWHLKGTSKCRFIFFKNVTGWAGSLNTITLLKFRKQALKMQKAYKLYFSANLQLVIGKDSNNKKILCVTCPSPRPKAEMKEKIKNRTKQKQKNYTIWLWDHLVIHYFQLKFFFNALKNHEKEKHTKAILLCLHCSSHLGWASV